MASTGRLNRRILQYVLFSLLGLTLIGFVYAFLVAVPSIQNTSGPSGGTVVSVNNTSLYGKGCPVNPYRDHFITLLRTWEAIAARRDITQYFLCFGSMLGAFRNGDVVPYDHDVDICMFRRDLYKLEQEDEKRPFVYDDGKPHMILQRQCHHPKDDIPRRDCAGNVVKEYMDACSIIDPCGRILLGSPPFLDVFSIKDNGEELLDEYENINYKRDIILPVKPCLFMGISTQCLNNPTVYLERNYGTNFSTVPHYVCKDGKWVATGKDVSPINVPV